MIGQVSTTHQPSTSISSFAPHQINCGGVYTNSINGSTVKVRNTNLSFPVIVAEKELFNAVRENNDLSSALQGRPTQEDRVISFGKAITAVYDLGKDRAAKALISEAFELPPRTASGDLESDLVMLKRGEYAIGALTNQKNAFTATTYAVGIQLDHSMGQVEPDLTYLVHLEFFLPASMPMKKTQQNEAENTISTSVPALRKVFEPE